MVESNAFREEWAEDEGRRDSGLPGGGKGRRDEVGHTGVYPASGPLPPGDAPVQEQYLDKAWGILQGDRVTVRVVFAALLARYIEERLWHPSQKLRPLPDGRVELTLRVADTLEVRRWILGFGAEAEVLEPETLREALRKEAEEVARQLAPTRRPLAPVAATRAGARGRLG